MNKTHFGYQTVDEVEKAGKVADVFHSVANKYDVMNDLMSFGLHRIWKKLTIARAQVRPGQRVLDIAGGVNGTWTGALVYDGAVALTTGTTGCYAPFENEGRMFYMNIYTASAINQIYRFDVQNRVMSPYTPTDFLQSGTAVVGGRMAAYAAIDGTDKYDVVLLTSHLSSVSQELIVLV
jgi:hypothetical protein